MFLWFCSWCQTGIPVEVHCILSALSELVSSADWPLDLIEWDSNTKVTLLGIKVGPVVMAMICRKPGFVWICCANLANLRVESRCNWCIYRLHMMWMWIRNMEHADKPMLLAVLCSGFCICPKKILYEACWWAASRLRSRDTQDGLCFVAKCQRFHTVQRKALGGGPWQLFQRFFIFSPTWEMIQFDLREIIFQMGWNHQLEQNCILSNFLTKVWNTFFGGALVDLSLLIHE